MGHAMRVVGSRRRLDHRNVRLGVLVALLVLAPWRAARAAPVMLGLDASSSDGSDPIHLDLAGESIPGSNLASFVGTTGTTFHLDWNLTVDPDPSINGTLHLTNLSSSTQTFTLTLTLAVSPIAAPSLMGGSFGDLTFTDVGTAAGDSDGSVTVVGNPFYEALIDGSSVQPLGVINVTGTGGPGVFVTIGKQEFGTPIPSAVGPAVASSIGMRVHFSLTAHDMVDIPLAFTVVPVPEPSSWMLLGLGLVGVVGARRKHIS